MKNVNVSKFKLVEILKQNKTKHVEEYRAAVPAYEQLIKNKAKEIASTAKGDKPNIKEVQKLAQELGYMRPPHNYSDEYDRAIEMLEMSVDGEYDLSESEFRQFVKDEWSFSHEVAGTNSVYARSAR